MRAAEKIKRSRIPRPFLKWVGGKTQILRELRQSVPSRYNGFHEPFLGGGAVFFDLLPSAAVLSDTNSELIDCFRAVRDHADDVVEALRAHEYDKSHYYAVRELDPEHLSLVERAARMIFLNKAGYNGLYRVNSKGKFNVPFGRHKNPKLCDEDNLRGCSAALAKVHIETASFENVVRKAKPSDLVYFDPPYIPVSDTADFTAYQKQGFTLADQERLAEVFDELSRRSVFAILSNSSVPWIHERYKNHNIRVIQARRFVNSVANGRGPVGEVIVTNF